MFRIQNIHVVYTYLFFNKYIVLSFIIFEYKVTVKLSKTIKKWSLNKIWGKIIKTNDGFQEIQFKLVKKILNIQVGFIISQALS